MNKKCSLFFTTLITFLSLSSFSLSSNASVAYIGDRVAYDVATRLEGSTLGKLEVSSVVDDSHYVASISNHEIWLPSAIQSVTASQPEMIILSAGMNDLQLEAYDFPSNAELDQAIKNILDALSPQASIYWVLPHSFTASQAQHHPGQLDKVVKAINRVKNRGKYPKVFLVNVDIWAGHYGLDMEALLRSDKNYLTDSGADTAAEHVIVFGELMAAFLY